MFAKFLGPSHGPSFYLSDRNTRNFAVSISDEEKPSQRVISLLFHHQFTMRPHCDQEAASKKGERMIENKMFSPGNSRSAYKYERRWAHNQDLSASQIQGRTLFRPGVDFHHRFIIKRQLIESESVRLPSFLFYLCGDSFSWSSSFWGFVEGSISVHGDIKVILRVVVIVCRA